MSIDITGQVSTINVTGEIKNNAFSVISGDCPRYSNWAELISLLGRGYDPPSPTGAITSYTNGDDAWVEQNILAAYRQAQTLKARNTLASFLLLNNTNSFGNYNRFTDELGTQIYANNYMVDNYYNIGWYLGYNTKTTWALAIPAALGTDFTTGTNSTLGYTNWFMPSQNVITTIVEQDIALSSSLHGFPTFPGGAGDFVHTSTTSLNANNYMRKQNPNAIHGDIETASKGANNSYYIFCRIHN